MGATASFNYQQWQQRYPEFASVGGDLAEVYWTEATIYHRNDGSGPVRNPAVQAMLLNMLTAHIAQLYKIRDGIAASELVGRIDSASEGSVSVNAVMDLPPAAQAQWFQQTKYGSSYWSASAAYRTVHYLPGPRRFFNPPFGGPFSGPFGGRIF